MKNVFNRVILLISVTSIFFVACADTQMPQIEVSLNESMDKWMKNNRSDVKFVDSGLYYNIYEKHIAGDIVTVTDTCIIEIFVNGKTIGGDYFLNSNELKARQLGEFSNSTRYAPFRYTPPKYASYPYTNAGINQVLNKMKAGDSATIFLSPANSYGAIGESTIYQYQGFGGSVHYSGNAITQFDIVLKTIEPSPEDSVLKATKEYALKNYGLKDVDTVKTGLYVVRLDSIGGGEFFGAIDTLVKLNYKGYFFDGFVFDTSFESLAIELGIFTPSREYKPLSYKNGKEISSEEKMTVARAIEYSVKKLKPGDKAIIITTSEWGYGKLGSGSLKTSSRVASSNNSSGTLIQPYTPLVFYVEIVIEE